MGQARQRKLAMIGNPVQAALNGGAHRPAVFGKQVPVVPNIKLQNHGQHIMLMLGASEPMLAAALDLESAKKLRAALDTHIEQLEQGERRIILPGE